MCDGAITALRARLSEVEAELATARELIVLLEEDQARRDAQPTPETVARQGTLHDVAREVYSAMKWAAKAGVPSNGAFPSYMDWGNSHAENEARRAAAAIIAKAEGRE
jgi:hypothetical protein